MSLGGLDGRNPTKFKFAKENHRPKDPDGGKLFILLGLKAQF